MKVKEVKHIYKSLKLIIHKKKYLIPQYPQKPIPLYTQFLILKKEDLKYSFKQMHEKVHQYIQDYPEEYERVKEKYDQQNRQFLIKKNEHKYLYLEPLNYVYQKPYQQFVKDKSSDIKVGKIGDIAKEWKSLSEQERQIYEVRDRENKRKMLDRYEQFVKKHEIPKAHKNNAAMEYVSERLREGNGETISKSLYSEFQVLDEGQKEKYKEIAQTNYIRSQQRYKNFLWMWKIEHEQLMYIRRICDEYYKQKESNRKKE